MVASEHLTDIAIVRGEPWDKVRIYEVVNQDGAQRLKSFFQAGQVCPGQLIDAAGHDLALLPQPLSASSRAYSGLETHRLIGNACAQALGDKDREVTSLIDELAEKLTIARQVIEDAIRFRVGPGVYGVEKKILKKGRNKGERFYVRLSHHGVQMERYRRYATSIAEELAAQSDRIGNLVEHRPTTGSYREFLLRALLQRHLPERFHVATGFIFGCARQVDILIYDRISHAPFFREGDFVVVPAEAARAVIEVKSFLNTADLCGSLGLLKELGGPRDEFAPPLFKGIFGYGSLTTATVIQSALAYYRGELDEEGQKYTKGPNEFQRIQFFDDPVSAICILGTSFLETGFARSSDKDCLRPFVREVRNRLARTSEVALFIDRLLDHLRYPPGASREARWSLELLTDEIVEEPAHFIEPDCDWGPYATGDASDLEARCTAFARWRHGLEFQAS